MTVLANSTASLEQTGYDNWNGGTYFHTLTLRVPADLYAQLGNGREKVEGEFLRRLGELTRGYQNEHLAQVIITMELQRDPEWREAMRRSAGLEEHLGFGEDIARTGQPTFWTTGYFRLFLSHVSSFKELAAQLQKALAKFGVSAFVAHTDIEPTKEWQDEIDLALNTMDALAALLTADFKASKWTDQEVGVSIGRGRLVVPVRLGLDPYGFIGKYQGFQGEGRTPDQISDGLTSVLLKHRLTGMRMTYALTTVFERSDSWDEAKATMTKLEEVAYMDGPIIERLERAASSNNQIAAAWGVPERLASLLKRLRPSGQDERTG